MNRRTISYNKGIHRRVKNAGYTLMVCCLATFILLSMTACQNRHEQLQKQIEQRKAAIQHKQDSTLQAAASEVERLDTLLQKAAKEYEKKKRAAEIAHESGTGTEEMYAEVNRLRQIRDSLQVRFDTECAKIRYVRRVRR